EGDEGGDTVLVVGGDLAVVNVEAHLAAPGRTPREPTIEDVVDGEGLRLGRLRRLRRRRNRRWSGGRRGRGRAGQEGDDRQPLAQRFRVHGASRARSMTASTCRIA